MAMPQSLARHLLRPCCRCQQPHRNINVWDGGPRGDRKFGWEHKIKQVSLKEKLTIGVKQLPKEAIKFGREVQEKFTPATWKMEHGDYQYLWKLNTQQAIDEWVVSTDRDMDQGQSTAEVTLSNQKCMLFHGFLNTTVPDDGKSKYAGYLNIRGPEDQRSFGRVVPYNWIDFTHLIVRCRGDGRPFYINLQMDNYFDQMWHDIYAFPLFTRGGPYWQTSKIPFSKFFLSNSGRVQDKQAPIILDRVKYLSLTLSDDAHGPFSLEIDYIGLMYDAYDRHEFFYEMYDGDPLMS